MRIGLWESACLLSNAAHAIHLDLNSPDSIKKAASTIAHGMMTYYKGNETGQIPGLLPQPPTGYYWWEAGAMFGSLIEYWYYTGDTTYNDVTTQAMLFQVGDDNDYEPRNQSSSLGNDDQSFWAFAAMTAAELNFPNPPQDKPQWLALAQAVFNRQDSRWNTGTCGGGMHWQIISVNKGYAYKNSISNGCFFALGARLGAYTGNTTYLARAERMWDWMSAIGLISPDYQVFDGSDSNLNCTQLDHMQWSYNGGVMLLGAATMWNQTTGAVQEKWKGRVTGLLKTNMAFFKDNTIMYEAACETTFSGPGICNTDQLSFKAYLSRWMAATTKLAPFTLSTIQPLLVSSANAAAAQCDGGSDGVTCGSRWWQGGTWDGTNGVGQQMCALEVIQANLIGEVHGPVGNKTGGTSQGDPDAGMGEGDVKPPVTVTTADKAGAAIVTAIVLGGLLGCAYWMISSE